VDPVRAKVGALRAARERVGLCVQGGRTVAVDRASLLVIRLAFGHPCSQTPRQRGVYGSYHWWERVRTEQCVRMGTVTLGSERRVFLVKGGYGFVGRMVSPHAKKKKPGKSAGKLRMQGNKVQG
jgi:hypothetical protein